MRARAIDLVDILVYVVVIALFVQFIPSIITESFGISLLTAVLFKCALELVAVVKKRIVARVRAAESAAGKILNAASFSLLGAGSKFLVLWLTDILFGDAVDLGGFFPVTFLIIMLMLARYGVRLLLDGERPRDGTA